MKENVSSGFRWSLSFIKMWSVRCELESDHACSHLIVWSHLPENSFLPLWKKKSMITWWPLLKERKTWPSVGDHIDFSFKWKMFSGLIIFYFIGIVHKGLKKRRFQIENDGSCLGHPLSSFLSFDINQKRKRKEDESGLCLTRSHIFRSSNLFFLLVQRINKEKNFRWTIKRKKIWKENVWAWAISHLLFARHLQMNAYAHGQTDGWRSYAHDPRLNVVFLDPIVGKSFRAWLLMSR